MTATVHRFPAPDRPALVSKRQLAEHLGRSPRWVEMRVKDGMPVQEATDRWGRRVYDLAAVEAWLANGRERPRGERLEDRVRRLEAQVRELLGRAS